MDVDSREVREYIRPQFVVGADITADERASFEVNTNIILRPVERLLRDLLLECAQDFPDLEIWITGGWVRDRLLGLPSTDIDLALNNVTGRQFGQRLETFCAKPEIESKYSRLAAEMGIADVRFTRFHIVERNADASKKLETAGGQLFGLDIDLVNLRKEVYDGHIRTPEMEFGTAEEDAFRRDATVNSLFFHLGRQEVVDHTGRGLKDLQRRVMATPLDPRQTFMADPLRVLRLIRVASKLGFTVDAEAMSCMKTDEIREALDKMITRDRINIEIFKIMRQTHPERAFNMVFEANLFVPVFMRLETSLYWAAEGDFPFPGPEPSPAKWPDAYRLLANLLEVDSSIGRMVKSEENAEYLWTMAAYAPLAWVRHPRQEEAAQAATDAIRLPAKISKVLEHALWNLRAIGRVVRMVASNPSDCSRSAVGMAIRSWGPNWTTQATYALLTGVPKSQEEDELYTMLDWYSAIADFVWDNGLQDAQSRRPLLDGNEIQALFGLHQGGRWMRGAIDGLLEWQFDHSNAGVDEAKEWHLSKREELGIPSD